MRATCWHGIQRVQVDDVPDSRVVNPRDAIVRITSTAICGSDLHLCNGFSPTMKSGDVLGHEFMGEVVETGSGVSNLTVGDRVVGPFPIACGRCAQCERELFSLCENSNPNTWIAEKMYGYSLCGIFGYSHMLGGYAGGQAEYVRVPFADVGALQRTGKNGGTICMHAENGGVIDVLVKQALAEGRTAPKYHALTRPARAEAEATHRAIALAEIADVPIHRLGRRWEIRAPLHPSY